MDKPDQVLTALQQHVLVRLFQAGLGEHGFYLTGGTALAGFHLHHRHSDDLDFFTGRTDAIPEIADRIGDWLAEADLEIVQADIQPEFARYFVREVGGLDPEPLKVEFARFTPVRMAPPLIVNGVIVDSIEDIAVNKICAVLDREPPETKDFVDLYFIVSVGVETPAFQAGMFSTSRMEVARSGVAELAPSGGG